MLKAFIPYLFSLFISTYKNIEIDYLHKNVCEQNQNGLHSLMQGVGRV